jgi:hypothetical protein
MLAPEGTPERAVVMRESSQEATEYHKKIIAGNEKRLRAMS